MIAQTNSLEAAQKLLGKGNSNNRQAIIPMMDRFAGDPHHFDKSWSKGSMWWNNANDINSMRATCSKVKTPCSGEMMIYYLRNKKVSARLHVYLRLDSRNHQRIGDSIEALQICKQSTQTASL